MSVVIEMPDPVMRAMRLPEREAPARLRRELAVCLYAKQLLDFGKARELAGLSVWEFHELLDSEHVPRNYDERELKQDLDTLASMQ